MKPTFCATDVIATAIAAYRQNQNQIVRVVIDDRLPNRQLMSECLQNNHINLASITEHDKQSADAMIDYLQQVAMVQTLIGRCDKFLNQITALIAQGEITTRDLGILAWAPKLAETYQQKDAVKEITARFGTSSQYIGRIGEKISFDFTLIEDHYVRSLECYAVFGRDQHNNFVRYWAKNKNKIIKQGPVRARIKNHTTDPYHANVAVTQLHYVKIL